MNDGANLSPKTNHHHLTTESILIPALDHDLLPIIMINGHLQLCNILFTSPLTNLNIICFYSPFTSHCLYDSIDLQYFIIANPSKVLQLKHEQCAAYMQ